MSLLTSPRRIRVIWHGSPFESLKNPGFSIQVSAMINSGAGGEPINRRATQWMYNDQVPDLAIDFGLVGIEEFGEGNVVAGAGPITVEGKTVWFSSHYNRMLAEEEEITVLARWHVSAVV